MIFYHFYNANEIRETGRSVASKHVSAERKQITRRQNVRSKAIVTHDFDKSGKYFSWGGGVLQTISSKYLRRARLIK